MVTIESFRDYPNESVAQCVLEIYLLTMGCVPSDASCFMSMLARLWIELRLPQK